MAFLARQQRLQAATAPIMKPFSVPAPLGGWNTRDGLDEMPPTDAITLDNWYPDYGGCIVRNGYQQFGLVPGSSPVKTLAEYSAGSTTKFLAASGGKIYDISPGGTIVTPALGSGYANDVWQTVSFLSRLFFCNGTDDAQIYDGATLAGVGFTGAPSNHFIGGIQYQNRLFFWLPNDTGFYFAQLNSITGALSFFDLAAFAPNGGNLTAAATYSHDGGNGVQDFIVFMLSSGDCLIYFGNDPSNANFWSLMGIYRISPPVNPRSVCQYGAEAFVTTFDDHIPLQQELVALKLGQLPPRSKVSTAVSTAVSANANGFGWQALYYPRGRRLMFNIPNLDGSFSQHVQNTALQGQPWCRFNMPAFTFGLYQNNLYFGGAAGTIYQADTGGLDLLQPIMATAQQAWSNFGIPMRKRVTAVRPLVQTTDAQSFTLGLAFDYGSANIMVEPIPGSSGSPWDTSPWDISPWSPENTVDPHWRIGGGTGQAISQSLVASTNQTTLWLRTDFQFELGSSL